MGDSAVIKAAAMAYFADTGWWPTTDSASAHDDVTRETENFVSGENQPAGWDGPYLDKWPRSPFSGSYYNYIYWGSFDAASAYSFVPVGDGVIFLQIRFCSEKIAKILKEKLDGTDELGPEGPDGYAVTTGHIIWFYPTSELQYVVINNIALPRLPEQNP